MEAGGAGGGACAVADAGAGAEATAAAGGIGDLTAARGLEEKMGMGAGARNSWTLGEAWTGGPGGGTVRRR